MKTRTKTALPSPSIILLPRIARDLSKNHDFHQNGAVLVIMLAIISLITLLVVGFLLRAGTERSAASAFHASASVRHLADTTVNLVQAQINHASTQGRNKTWASQPGAIRLFDSGGNLERIYRLYSAASLITGSASDLANDLPTNNTWANNPELWVDLNAPITVTETVGTSRSMFPILDPRDPVDPTKTVSLDGFSLTAPPGATPEQKAPMPVRWLYVLQNGEIQAPTIVSTGVVSVIGANKDNPIVGRIAFWTDDESSKVNINTASDGTFWDTPRCDAPDEKNRAKYQPAAGEFQAYPSHPATTSLRNILTSLSSEDLFNVLPRFTYGGSKGGKQIATGAIPAKKERLYTSIGELFFNPNRDRNTVLSRQQLDTSRFFLTAHSRAPEVTSCGTPRISIWPIHETNDTDHRTATDQLISFCSTANNHAYYFTRSDPYSPTSDISLVRNNELLNYLDKLTSTDIPGCGGSFSTKYGQQEKRQILTEIFDYIRCVNINDPSVAHAFADPDPSIPEEVDVKGVKGEAGQGQVVPAISAWGTQGFGRFHRLMEVAIDFIGVGKGANTLNPVSNPELNKAEAVYAGQVPGYTGGINNSTTPPDNTVAVEALVLFSFITPSPGFHYLYPHFTIEVENLDSLTLNGELLNIPQSASLTFNSARGVSAQSTLDCSNGVSIPSTQMTAKGPTPINRKLGMGPRNYPFYSKILTIPINSGVMNFSGGNRDVTIKVYAGGSDNTPDKTKLIQTYKIKFPSISIPIPTVPVPMVTSTNSSTGAVTSTPKATDGQIRFGTSENMNSGDRFAFGNLEKGIPITVLEHDVIFSMIPSVQYADYRLLAKYEIPNDGFVVYPTTSGTTRFAASLPKQGGTWADFGDINTDAKVAADLKIGKASGFAPKTLHGAYIDSTTIPGDRDTDIARYSEGPYINKPDQGNTCDLAIGSIPYFDSGYYQSTTAAFFSPNRQIASAVSFGSLSTGVVSNKGWQTLLFRPSPGGHPGEKDRPSLTNPPDHQLLDLFWMPVAEPYAISEPFSTAGKINLNYQIVPFTYIKRSTAMRSVLAAECVAKLPNNKATIYKTTGLGSTNARYPLNLSGTDGTLRQFEERFASGDIFHSASEICDIFMVPNNASWKTDEAARTAWYGADFGLVGDNLRERPYAGIYPRVTTKSNIFTVFFTVQALKNPSRDPARWEESRGLVVGDYRGSTTIERYIDPNNSAILDYATDLNAPSLDSIYKWRIITNSRFPQ